MTGKCWKFGDDVNTDEIIPARHLSMMDRDEMAAHCMEGLQEDFAKLAKPGDLIVGGKNFGCGSSREHAPICIQASGLQCVVAESFARIFFRNCINIGLRIAECPEAARDAETGDELEVDFTEGRIENKTKGKTYQFPPFSPELQAIIDAGGLIPWAKERVKG